ncbi:DNA topoisomerase IB, partial [Allorhizobium undicola]
LEEIADLPGRELFTYQDEEGLSHRIDSGRLNTYLGTISGQAISAKTFRTWGGTLAGFKAALQAVKEDRSPTIKEICTAAAEALHNPPAICRSSYVHPDVLSLATLAGPQERQALLHDLKDVKPRSGQKADEARLLSYLRMVGDILTKK